jgi:hypothetical protein
MVEMKVQCVYFDPSDPFCKGRLSRLVSA